jgi:NAD(P)-dependent dehydrogenase (short-subunit alcohol dehydrogenase family)
MKPISVSHTTNEGAFDTGSKTDAPVALVTGAANGIGWAVAQRFATEGIAVVIVDLDQTAAQARVAELGGGLHHAIGADVASESQVIAMVDAVKQRYGRLDILVNNAGIGEQAAPTVEQDMAAFDRLLAIHLRGTFMASREAGRIMLEAGGGAIVNLCSFAGLAGIPTRNAYGAAKAGIASMTRSMAVEWARKGVRVNGVAPAYVATELVKQLVANRQLNIAGVERRTPMGRLAQPSEIADAIAFLASDAASYITGTILNVDGGWMASGSTGD